MCAGGVAGTVNSKEQLTIHQKSRCSYMFDSNLKKCNLFWYSGCNGTSRNHFGNQQTCEEMCERSHVLDRARESFVAAADIASLSICRCMLGSVRCIFGGAVRGGGLASTVSIQFDTVDCMNGVDITSIRPH